MYQRLLILKKWEEAGLKKSGKKKVRDFIEFVEKNPKLGWDAYGKKFRKNYYDVLNDVIPPLLDIGDNLITLNLIRLSDPKKHRKEMNLLKDFVRKADSKKLQLSLEAIAKLKMSSLNKTLEGRKDLPPQLRAVLFEPKKPSKV